MNPLQYIAASKGLNIVTLNLFIIGFYETTQDKMVVAIVCYILAVASWLGEMLVKYYFHVPTCDTPKKENVTEEDGDELLLHDDKEI